jgi:L-asparaginase
MSRPQVAVGTTGGTISMTPGEGGSGVRPTLGAAELLAAVPGLVEVAEVSTSTLATVPGAHLTPADVAGFGRWAAQAVREADGAVLVQGTDTIEESAYLLDLLWDAEEPLVVTGAMRAAHAAGADGPANLMSAVVVAGSRSARGRGVLVALDDDVHAASRVRKGDSTAPHAFASEPFGLLGRVHERSVTFVSPATRWPALPTPEDGRAPRVALLETHLGDVGDLLGLVVDAGYDGVVVAGFGVGHVSGEMADVVGAVAHRLPVVLASRTGSGPVLRGTYGFPGSEQDLIGRGAVPAGWLDPRKARLLLWALLAGGAGPDHVRRVVEERGARPWGPTG